MTDRDDGEVIEPSERILATPVRQSVLRARAEPAFVIATYPWKETSLVAEVFTQHYGRVGVSIRGAKRATSRFRGLINPFNPLLVSFAGSAELKPVTDIRWLGPLTPLSGEGLLSAFYLNELILRLLPREVPHPELFDSYRHALADIATGEEGTLQRTLRRFEVELLRRCGWGQIWDDSLEEPFVVRDGEIVSARGRSLMPMETPFGEAAARAVLERNFTDASLLRDSQRILRQVIGHYVGDRGLATRKTLSKWRQLLG